MQMSIFTCDSEQIDAIIRRISTTIAQVLLQQDNIVIAVSGGKSPIKLFNALSQTDLPWHKVKITLVDERSVEATHVDSSENLVRTFLLKNKAACAEFITIDQNAEIQIDMAVLGMGEDGHTASIFPDCPELSQALDLSNKAQYIVTNPLSAKHQRVTLTLAALVKIPHLILSISGELKLNVIKESMQHSSYPISHVIKQRSDIQVYWYE